MRWAEKALAAFKAEPWTHALDIGSGPGDHARALRGPGRQVTTIDHHPRADIQALWPTPIAAWRLVDAIWSSHCLEHSPNPGLWLAAAREVLPPEGALCLTVPPAKHAIVGGHVTLWNAGLLLYQLVLAGFDCAQARVATYGYNISVLISPTPVAVLPSLAHDSGDINRLAQYFPLKVSDGFDGQIDDINWP